MENIPPINDAENTENTEELVIVPEQKEIILEFMKQSNNHSIAENVEPVDHYKAMLAEQLLALDIGRGADDANVRVEHPEYPYRPELELREEIMKEAGLGDRKDISIHRYNVVLGRDTNNQLPVKIIGLVRDSLDEDRRPVHTPIPGGVLFMGKVSFEGTEHYIDLTDEELERIEAFVEKNKASSEK